MRAFLFTFCLLFTSLYGEEIMLFSLPQEAPKALRAMLFQIDHARSSIDAAIYSFTHKTIAKHLVKAAKRGVKIRIVFDRSANLGSRNSRLGYLSKYRNIQTYIIRGRPFRSHKEHHGLMHLKAMVIDHKVVIAGSANWTYSGFGKNYELLCIAKSYALAQKLDRQLQTLFRMATPY